VTPPLSFPQQDVLTIRFFRTCFPLVPQAPAPPPLYVRDLNFSVCFLSFRFNTLLLTLFVLLPLAFFCANSLVPIGKSSCLHAAVSTCSSYFRADMFPSTHGALAPEDSVMPDLFSPRFFFVLRPPPLWLHVRCDTSLRYECFLQMWDLCSPGVFVVGFPPPPSVPLLET